MPDTNTQDTKSKLNRVFQEVFGDDSIRISDEMTAKDIDGWDSLTHVNLIVAVEKRFKIAFTTKEVVSLRNVGDFYGLIVKKLAA